MKARIIYTSYFQSERILSLSADARWLFIYFLICPYIGLTGAFKLARSKIKFESALNEARLSVAEQELVSAGLVELCDGWIIIPDTEQKTNYHIGKTTGVAYRNELNKLPQKIKERLIALSVYPIDTLSIAHDTPRNKNIEIRNQKEEIYIGEKVKTEAEEVADDFEDYQKGLN